MAIRSERAMPFEKFIELLLRERNADWPGNPKIMVRHKGGAISDITGIDVDPINAPVEGGEPDDVETVGATIYIEVQ